MGATGVFLGCGLVPHLWSSSPVEKVGHHYPRRGWGRRRAGIMLIWRWRMLEEVMEKSSVQFSSVQSLSHVRPLQPHWLQHARLPCPSPTTGACSNSCPSSWWCHTTISSSVVSFSSCFQSFPASGSFLVSQFFAPGGQSIGVSAFSISPSNEYSGLISFRIDWFNLLEPQFPHLQGPETLKKTWPPIDLWAGPGQWEASPSLPCPRNVRSVCCSYSWNCFQGCILDRAMWCWEQLDWMCDWNCYGLYTKLWDSGSGCKDVLFLSAQDKPHK